MSDRKVYCHTSGILKGVKLNTKEITAGTVVVMNVRFNIFLVLTNDDFPLPSSSYLKLC